MAGLKNIKLKITSVKKTSTVTRAMEAVSAVKMRKSQERALGARAYASAALAVLTKLSGTIDARRHPLMQHRAEGKTLFIVITSDKGLAGSLNSGVIRAVERRMEHSALAKEDVRMIGIGRRGADYFASRGYEVRVRRENVSDDISLEAMRIATEDIFEWHKTGEIATVLVAYTNLFSTFEQKPVIHQIVPVVPEVVSRLVEEIVPVRGKYSGLSARDIQAPDAYTIEPDADSVFAELLPRLIDIAVFHALLESKASEHSARMVAMKSATDNAREKAKEYTRLFNKARQAAITREISEITSGIEAMR